MSQEEPRTIVEWCKSIQSEIRDTREHIDGKIDRLREDLNGRVRKLETEGARDKGKVMGVVLVISGAASALWSLLLAWIKGGG